MDSRDIESSSETEPNEQFKYAVDPRLGTPGGYDGSGIATIIGLFIGIVVVAILTFMSRWLVASRTDIAHLHLLDLPLWAIQLAAIGGSLLVVICAVMVYASITNIYHLIQYATGTGPIIDNVLIDVLKIVTTTATLCVCTALYLFAFYLV